MAGEHIKHRQPLGFALMLLLVSAGMLSAATVAAQTPDLLSDLKLPNTTIVSVETVAAGAFTLKTARPVLGLKEQSAARLKCESLRIAVAISPYLRPRTFGRDKRIVRRHSAVVV